MISHPTRTAFLLGALGAATLASTEPARAVSGSGRARPGPYCLPLRKGVTDTRFDFELELLDGNGQTFSLGALRGTAVWLNFFASWCPPCNAECERVVQIADLYRPYGLTTIGIDVEEKPEPVRAYRDRHKVTFPIALDTKGSVFKYFGFQAFPTHLFFDRDGRVTCLAVDDISYPSMENEISVALGIPSLKASPAPAMPAASPSPEPSATPIPG